MADALIIVDYQNDFARPDGALSVPAGEEVAGAHQRRSPAPATTSSCVATRDWHPPDHGSFTEQGGIWPVHCVQGSDGAELHPALDTGPIDAIVDKGQDPGTEGYSAFDATALAERAARPRRGRGHGRRPGHGLLRQEHRARRPARGLRRARRLAPASAASRSSRATPSAPSRSWRRRVRPWRSRPGEGRPARAPARGLRPHVSDARVLAAIRAVPRDRFVPDAPAEEAWDNVALPIGSGQTISQPLVVARMCELLELRGDERVLDVGTGSGYHAAVLAQLVAPRLEHRAAPRAVGSWPASSLAAAGVDNVTLLVGDGALGHPPGAPYDAINVAAAMGAMPPALPDQLAAGGRLVGPGRRRRPAARAAAPRRGRRAAALGARARALRAAGRADEGEPRVGAVARARPSRTAARRPATTSAVKSLEPRISAEPTP